MAYLTAKQFADKWGITERRIIKLCKENRISGAEKNGMVWLIPEDTIKPSDKRSKIFKYINTQKRIMIVNINTQIGYHLIPLLKKEGYEVNGMCNENTIIINEKLDNIKFWKINNKSTLEQIIQDTEKYYDGLIFIDTNEFNKTEQMNKETIIKEFAKKMNCESAIVLVNYLQNVKEKLEVKLSNELEEKVGLRINTVNINAPSNSIISYKDIAEDVLQLLIRFKNTTGMSIITDGGYLKLNKDGRTDGLEIGKFYKVINSYLKNLSKGSYMWCASTMLEDEWTEEPAEMNFRVNNLEAANRGVNLERIFIFSKDKIKEFRENKTLKIYMQSNIKTMFVDYEEIKAKEPELLKIVGNGWDGIAKNTLIVDLPEGSKERGYISKNTKEVLKAYECFQELKKYSQDLKEVLK